MLCPCVGTVSRNEITDALRKGTLYTDAGSRNIIVWWRICGRCGALYMGTMSRNMNIRVSELVALWCPLHGHRE